MKKFMLMILSIFLVLPTYAFNREEASGIQLYKKINPAIFLRRKEKYFGFANLTCQKNKKVPPPSEGRGLPRNP